MTPPLPESPKVTLAILGERLARTMDTLERVEVKVDKLQGDHATVESLDKRLTALETWHTWMLRTVLGVVILTGLGVIFAAAPAW